MRGAALAWTSWMISLVSSSFYTKDTLPDIQNEDFIRNCSLFHNKFRSEVNPSATNMMYMTWDPVLAQIAKGWAKKCLFAHNTQLSQKLHPNFTALGENIWSGSMSLFSVSNAIASWYNEVRFYEFRTRKCNHVCGHYTQVVWADSYKVGCAVQFCPQVTGISYSNVAHFVCNYGPAGNYPTWPYEKGHSCSACQKNDKCLYNLCVNQQRDQVTGYFTNEFPGRPVYFRNKYLSLFLIVSPLIIILSVIVTIWVKYKTPNIVPVG